MGERRSKAAQLVGLLEIVKAMADEGRPAPPVCDNCGKPVAGPPKASDDGTEQAWCSADCRDAWYRDEGDGGAA